MDATEARELSKKQAQAIAKRNAEKAAKMAENKAKAEKYRRQEFYAELLARADNSIKYATESGETSVKLSIGGEWDHEWQAEKEMREHQDRDLIDKAIKFWTQRGYNVKLGTHTIWFTTQHESTVPDFDYSYAYSHIEISW